MRANIQEQNSRMSHSGHFGQLSLPRESSEDNLYLKKYNLNKMTNTRSHSVVDHPPPLSLSPDHSNRLTLPVVKINGRGTSLSVYSPTASFKRTTISPFSQQSSPDSLASDTQGDINDANQNPVAGWREIDSRGFISNNNAIPKLRFSSDARCSGSSCDNHGSSGHTTCEYERCGLSCSITLPVIEEILVDEGFSDVSISQQLRFLQERDECTHSSINTLRQSPQRSSRKTRFLSPLSPKSPSSTSMRKDVTVSYSLPLRASSRPGSPLGYPRETPCSSPRNHVAPATTRRGNSSRHSSRYKPWTAAYSVMGQPLDDDRWKEELYICQSDIEKTKWLSEQQLERGMMGNSFIPPRILILSSKINKVDLLRSFVVRKEKHIICISYDYDHSTLSGIMSEIKTKLEEYKHGAKAKSVMLYCQGGPGYLYMLKKKVLTPQKLKKEENQDMVMFWRELGDCISKVPPEESVVYIMGCYVLGDKQGYQLFQDLKQVIQPNIVRLECPMEKSASGKKAIETYFDVKKYEVWKSQKNSSCEDFDWTVSETVESTEDDPTG